VLTFCQDVCFDEGKTDPPANHFRHMINPNAYTDKQNFPENTLCGWSAKIPAAHAYSHERSRMVPIYKGDWGRLMKYDGYLCYREYYCTFATPPQGTFVQRCAKRDKPLGLWEKVPPPPTRRFRRMVAVVQPGDGDGQSANISFVERHDMDEGVEVSLDVTGGELKGDEGTGDPLPVADIPPRPEVGKKGEDDDYFEGENLDGELLEEGER
jgi:hypothetical protein